MPVKIDGTGYINSSYLGTANNIYTDANGRVGIGTTSPANLLEVSGSAANIYLRSNDSGDATLRYMGVSSERATVRASSTNALYMETAGIERMRIDSGGRVTKAFQPSFFVWSNYSSGGGPSGIYIFANVDHNIGSGYSTATGRFTAPIAGRYLLMTGILSRSGAGMNMSMRKNGSIIAYAEDSRTGGYGEANITLVVNLNASDYIDINLSNSSYGGAYDWFSGYLLG